MHCSVSIKKFSTIIIMLVLLIVQWAIINPYIDGNVQNADFVLQKLSYLCVISVILEVFLWWRLTGELFSPYIVFFAVLFIFTCGQSIGWATGLDLGDRDMHIRFGNSGELSLLIRGLGYSLMGISSFHLGAIFYYKDLGIFQNKIRWSAEYVTNIYTNLSKLLLCIAIPSFFAKTIYDVIAVATGGYRNYYNVNVSRSSLMSILNIFADYYQPCLMILLIANRENKRVRRIIVTAMMVDVVISLYIGGRSNAVMTLLGILLAYHYFVKPFKVKQAILGVFAAYFGVRFLNGIASIRGMANRNIMDMIEVMFSPTTNVIGEFIGELGWTITSICWTMSLVPSSYPFRYGMSYLVSFLSWIPSGVFGGRANNPVVIWGNLSEWLQNALHMGYGPGYTTVAESYINFGWYGIIALGVAYDCV